LRILAPQVAELKINVCAGLRESAAENQFGILIFFRAPCALHRKPFFNLVVCCVIFGLE
jgi:hypothetical protein